MADLGHISLILAFICAVYAGIASIFGIRNHHAALTASARAAFAVVFILFTLALEIMIGALVDDDFSISLVAEHSSRDLTLPYKLAALYAGKVGSLMFWGWLISLMSTIAVFRKRHSFSESMPYIIAILAGILSFFLAMVALVENVFQETANVPADGVGLNPLLQNPGMILHPLLLFLGFAGLAVVFAFVMGALISGQTGSRWVGGIRRWTLLAWVFLGIGNLAGAWWAYVELGWGGYWAWDPVENAGLMPWLLATALVHSMAVYRRRSYLQKWAVLLAGFAFIFTLLSPFITHGGIESPLHGFVDSPFPPYLLVFMLVAAAGTLIIAIVRWDALNDREPSRSVVSREGAFLLTNVLLVLTVAVILLGTVLPGITDALGDEASVGRDFFDRSAAPTLLLLVFVMGICPLLRWRKSSLSAIRSNFLYPVLISLVAALALLISGIGNWYAVAAVACGLPLVSVLQEWIRTTWARCRNRKENLLQATVRMVRSDPPRFGGYVVHIGIILITVGIIGSTFYDAEKMENLHPGESASIRGYELVYNGLNQRNSSEKLVTEADISVFNGGKPIFSLHPENNFWYRQSNRYAEAAIHSTVKQDLFVSLVSYDPETHLATFRILVNPLVMWMWIGGGVLVLGFVIAASSGQPVRRETVEDRIETEVLKLRQGTGKRQCSACGAEYEARDRFCSECGASLGTADREEG